ncbi:MAG TPA: ATP-binding cassette domain-containing protein, partial [Bacteroidales bacterium]|nr:ATP-binding cassette domain-containing protein [Bacteroidales bacterium]
QLVLSDNETLSAEVFIFYITVFSQLIQPAKAFTTAFYNVQRGVASAQRIKEIIDADEVIVEKENPISIKTFEREIEYKNICFAYNKEIVLDNINLKIPKGRTIAIIGPSGAGKSTMVDLLPRFYDPTRGEILIDGLPIKDCIISDIRELIGIVSQETVLFNDTVFNNIAFGKKNVTLEEVISAAKIANAHEFIEKMEKGYYSNIGDRGCRLSGGQRQRISIARAVLKNPPILILDEATSSLDTESERLVQESLYNIMKNRTSIVIAHRLSTIRQVDEIIVLQKGKIVERGTHDQLMSLHGIYFKLVELQTFH